MEKISFGLADGEEDAQFYVLEQTTIRGINYLLVTDSEEDEAETWILKEIPQEGKETEAVYEIVDEDGELDAVSKVFMAMMDDTEIQI